MPDRKKVIEALECCLDIVKSGRWASGCISCPYAEEKNNCREKMIMDALILLKEHGSIEPVLDETTKRFYRCGACGEYVGFIDSDPGDPNEQDNYCRNCGREVKWK